MRLIALALVALVALAGCTPSGVSTGGSGNGGLATAVGPGTAPYALLDLQTRGIEYRASLPDLAGNAAYRDRTMVFRRVGSGSGQVLIGVFTVTQAQWGRLDATAPWTAVPATVVSASAQQPDHPAYGLDYETVVPVLAAFAIPGAHLAVPDGAQYETAAGASSGWTWGAAADLGTLQANALVRETAVDQGHLSRLDANGNDIGGPQAVGLLAPNANGLYDIHGNVWQLTAPGTQVRGGSWYDPASVGRIETRAGVSEGLGVDVPHALIGVRLILVLQ